jgi:uncharacterized repeat protein (TIGR01451 family)
MFSYSKNLIFNLIESKKGKNYTELSKSPNILLSLKLLLLFIVLGNTMNAQILRPFTQRYYNPSVKGNIVYVSNSIISTSGVGSGIPGTGEIAPAGSSMDNNGNGINIDIDNGASVTKLPFGSGWNYFSRGSAPTDDGSGNTWKALNYSLTGSWNTGASPVAGLGKYGFNSGQTTCIPSGVTPICTPGSGSKYTAYYFRNTVSFTATELSTTFNVIQVNLKRDDGIVVYINGVERIRNNMPTGAIAYNTTASSNIAVGAAENVSVSLSPTFFTAGVNTIAVEVHLRSATRNDMSFDMEVSGVNDNGTFNSSSADLNLSSCSSILFAGLYWGAGEGASSNNTSWITGETTCKIKLPGSTSFTNITSSQTDYYNSSNPVGFIYTGFQCYADITSLLSTNSPNGTYTLANVTSPMGKSNAYGGWTIVVVYANPSQQSRNLTVFDGSAIVQLGNPPVDVGINGFLTPATGPVSCELGTVAYDGDRSWTDSFAFKQNGAAAFYNLTPNATANLNDMWNSSIAYKGATVTTRNPAFNNTLGYDANIIDMPNSGNAQLGNSKTSATVRFSSPEEMIIAHVLTTAITQYNPTFDFVKTSTDINGGLVNAGDSLRYQMNYTNVGNDASIQTTLTDNIPLGTSYKPGTLKINGIAKTDIAGDDEAEFDLTNNKVVFRLGAAANASTGGNMAVAATGNVQFDVLLTTSCTIINCLGDSVKNAARLSYAGFTSGALLFDSSGVNNGGCIIKGPVVNYVNWSCTSSSDTLLVNSCPVTSVTLPWRRFAGYTIYSAMPFIPANIYDPLIPVTSSHVYWAYFKNPLGCADTVRIRVFIIACPDIDDDNDGIPDYVELNNPTALLDANSNGIPNWNDATYAGFIDNNADGFNDNFDPSADSDNDGILNFYDVNFPSYTDSNADGINDAMDKDLDGIPNHLDLDSDNDGIPDVVESYGVDQNGDGVIDNYSTSDNDGFSQNVDASATGVAGSGVGLGAQDLDKDGIPNYLDTDSDNDGIPDVLEALGIDTDNDGYIDGFTDTDGDGLSDNVDADLGNDGTAENTAISLLRTSADTNADGRADSYPYKNMDIDSRSNPYDLDSDMDGIADVIEAGFTDANFNGFVDGPIGTNGWNLALNARVTLDLRNTEGRSGPDYLDIDADDDGITDNVEGQTTLGYFFPFYLDNDKDGIDNRYDNYNGFGGSGIMVADKDWDDIPDYIDLDTDSDGVLDIVEGNDFNLNGLADDDVALTFLDDDGDGLDNKFDSINSVTNIKGTSYKMGTGGSLIGDPAPGTRSPVQKKILTQSERDWRYIDYILPLQMLKFAAVQNNNIVKLNWDIVSTQLLDKFEIERSTDNSRFEKVNTLLATTLLVNTFKNYNTIDDINNISSQVIFYRIKIIAQNGQSKFSEVVIIRKELHKTQVNIYPNPARDHVTISFYADKDATQTIKLLDMSGRIVLQQSQKIQKGSNSVQLNGLARFNDGIYNLQLIIDNELTTQKLIIHN